MTETFQAGEPEAIQSTISIAISNFNAIAVLIGVLAREGIIGQSDLDFLHTNMQRPLDGHEGGHEGMTALHSRRIDDLCAGIAKVIQSRS